MAQIMSETDKSKISEIAHEVESGNIEPDFVLYRMENKITVGKKATALLLGVGSIAFGIILGVIFGLGRGGWVAILPFALFGSVCIWSVLRLKPSFSEIVHQSISQIFISSINLLIDYEFQNNEIVNCKAMPLADDSFIKYQKLQGDNRVNHTYKLITGKEKTTLRGEPHTLNREFAKKYGIEIIQTKDNI